MKVGILKADSVLEQFQPVHGDYPEMFVKRLSENAETPLSFQTYDVEHGEYPEDIDECDGYVITGSKKSVYDDEPWIAQLQAFVVTLDAHRKPLLGICFGHQMVAQALGGKTEAASVGWGVGVHTSKIQREPSFMQPPAESIKLLVSHKDQVTSLPKDAEVIATSDFCPVSMFVIGQHILCMQGHPEFRHEYSRDLMNMRREVLGEAVFSNGLASLEESINADQVARWMLQFLNQAAAHYAAAGV